MDYSKYELINAVKIIKETCKKYVHGNHIVAECPFGYCCEDCFLSDDWPYKWDITLIK